MQIHEVILKATGQRFAAREDETILTAAQRAGIAMSSSCRTGTCRTCLRQLKSGTVAYAVEWPGVLPDEKAQGWILPCVAQARSALVVAGDAQRTWWE